MSQVTIYLPKDLEADLRAAAQRTGQSLSGYVAGLARKSVHPAEWSEEFRATFGAWEGEELTAPDDPPPEVVEGV